MATVRYGFANIDITVPIPVAYPLDATVNAVWIVDGFPDQRNSVSVSSQIPNSGVTVGQMITAAKNMIEAQLQNEGPGSNTVVEDGGIGA